MKKRLLSMALAAAVLTGCAGDSTDTTQPSDVPAPPAQEVDRERDTLCQISLLQGLLSGDFQGSISIGELKTYGDMGIGTFDGVDGELIMLDGVVYQAKGDGTVAQPDDSLTIPFANVTFFEPDEQVTYTDVESFEALTELLDGEVERLGENRFYMVRIDGTFTEMHARSEYAQEEPYRTLVEALAEDQTYFDYEDVEGTVVALYCPVYMSELNNAGWHLHFISADRTQGGHVLDLASDELTVTIDCTDSFEMLLPDSEYFVNADFSLDRSEDVRRAETNE
jgi:acetolactate decarboxylase